MGNSFPAMSNLFGALFASLLASLSGMFLPLTGGTINGNVVENGNFTVNGALTNNGNTNITGSLNAGPTTVTGLADSGGATFVGSVSTGPLTCPSQSCGPSTFSGINDTGTLTVTGTSTVGVVNGGAVTFSSVTDTGLLNVTGPSTVGVVNGGVATFASVTSNGNMTSNGNIVFSNGTQLTSPVNGTLVIETSGLGFGTLILGSPAVGGPVPMLIGSTNTLTLKNTNSQFIGMSANNFVAQNAIQTNILGLTGQGMTFGAGGAHNTLRIDYTGTNAIYWLQTNAGSQSDAFILQGFSVRSLASGSYTLLNTDIASHFDNQAATGTTTYNLPTPSKGYAAAFTQMSATQSLIVATPSGSIVLPGLSASSITSTVQNSTVLLVCHDGTNWEAEFVEGNWGQTVFGANLTIVGNSNLNGISLGISTKTANYNVTVNDHTLLGNATSGAITFFLPSAASAAKLLINPRKIDASANGVFIVQAGGDTIDGSTSNRALFVPQSGYPIQSDGINGWWTQGNRGVIRTINLPLATNVTTTSATFAAVTGMSQSITTSGNTSLVISLTGSTSNSAASNYVSQYEVLLDGATTVCTAASGFQGGTLSTGQIPTSLSCTGKTANIAAPTTHTVSVSWLTSGGTLRCNGASATNSESMNLQIMETEH